MGRKKTITEKEKKRRKIARNNKWNSQNIVTVRIFLNKEKDKEILDYIEKCENKTEAVRRALLNAIKDK